MMRIEKAIVTGSSGTLGSSITFGLGYQYGAKVYKPSHEECDVSDFSSVEEYVKKFDNIDILVNCAGISHKGSIEEMSEKDLMDVYKVNVLGTFNFCKAVLPIMKKQKSGYIINIGSLRGIECCKNKAAYSMSKFAVRAFSKTLALEVAPYGIKVTCINPGFVYSKLIQKRIDEEHLTHDDLLFPEDISRTVIYLLGLSKGAVIHELNLGEVWE